MYVRSMYRISKKVSVVFLSVMTLALLLAPSGARGQTATASISFLSPSSFNGEVPTVTDADGGVDSAFRLSAWTANAPAGALVEFELVPGDNLSPAVTIGTGQSVAVDTYEYLWDVAEGPTGILEGGHTLKAILYDASGVEIASDSLTVNLLHGTGTSTGDGEPAIDLTYPVSGGVLGQYRASGEAANSVLDGIHKDAQASVRPYFTTSTPGTAPNWVACGTGESTARYGDGVRCTYPSDDPSTDITEGVDPTKVTAVALLLLTKNTSADTARVFPYEQVPSDLTFEMLAPGRSGGPGTAPGSRSVEKLDTGAFPCSHWVRTLLTDQVGRKVAGANIDAHATGPSDQLKFHTGYLSIDPPHSRPPSEGHGFPEPGTNCRIDADTIAKQGEHGIAAAADRKHIESVAGTRDSGFFDLSLRTDQPGVTQLTVWADKTEDDKYCSDESDAALSTSLGWGTGEPTTEPEAPSDCGTVPDPDPTVDPDPDPDPDPGFDGSRSVRIETPSTSVPAGRKAKVIGVIDAADETCSVTQTLKLRAKRPSASRFRTIATRTTDVYGLHGFSVRVRKTKVYRIVAPAAGECVRAVSEIRKIRAL